MEDALSLFLTGLLAGGYATAALFYDGDIEAFYATIWGEEGEPDSTPAPSPNVAKALHYMDANHPEARIVFVTVHEPGTAGQHVQIVAEHPRRLIFGEYYAFDSAGNFHGTAGLADGALGQQAAASNYRLHFGNFGGLPVKLLYFVCGLALTAVAVTGTYIWLGKRARRGVAEPKLRAAWNGVVWGTPVALAATAAARAAIGHEAPFAAIFWLGLSLYVALSILAALRKRPLAQRAVA